jgi:ADP-ribosylglycohydrolase
MATDLKTTALYDHALGCMLGGLIGDAIGTPTEGKHYRDIEAKYGWVADFDCDGTDDTVMKVLLSRALIRTDGYANLDDWAGVWLDNWQDIFSSKMAKFFISVLHTAHKLRRHATPRMAALGNMPSSSSAMCISPVGIINACNPRMAALQTYDLASLIHVQEVGFCQDGAVAMAAAVAEAFRPGASVRSVLDASTAYILPTSGAEMLAAIDAALSLARETGDFHRFREAAYARADSMFCRITCDSRETVPITLALFLLADGDVERCVAYGANFGRDADTIASMAGAIAGALHGVGGIRSEWVEKANLLSGSVSVQLAEGLVGAAMRKAEAEQAAAALFGEIAS